MKRRALYTPQAYFAACLLPLLFADGIRILITYHYSADRGMWPLFLLVMVCLTFLYSGLAYLPARLTRHFDVGIAFWHHTALGVVLISFTLAYHLAKPDWLAVNNGLRRLTPFQSVIYSHWAPWSIYLFFYLILIFRVSKHRDGS